MTADQIVDRAGDLKPPAPAVIRLLSLLNRPDAGSDQVIRIVEQDVVLSARVLSLCNSAWLGNAAPVASVSQALLRLGYQQIHRIVMTVSFGTRMHSPLAGYAIDEEELWRHSLFTAHIARKILDACNGFHGDPSIAFTAAIVHDIGKLVLNGFIGAETQAAIMARTASGECSMVEAERLVIGADHCEVGANLLTRWKLPENIIEAVANHHAPPLEPRPALSALVHLADAIAHEAGSAPGMESFAIPFENAAPAALGISPKVMDLLLIGAVDASHSDPELATHHGSPA